MSPSPPSSVPRPARARSPARRRPAAPAPVPTPTRNAPKVRETWRRRHSAAATARRSRARAWHLPLTGRLGIASARPRLSTRIHHPGAALGGSLGPPTSAAPPSVPMPSPSNRLPPTTSRQCRLCQSLQWRSRSCHRSRGLATLKRHHLPRRRLRPSSQRHLLPRATPRLQRTSSPPGRRLLAAWVGATQQCGGTSTISRPAPLHAYPPQTRGHRLSPRVPPDRCRIRRHRRSGTIRRRPSRRRRCHRRLRSGLP